MRNSTSTDTKTHATAIAIAHRCVLSISSLLEEAEQAEALRKFYSIAKQELKQTQEEGDQPKAESIAVR
jgi:hypothetical protein